MSANRAVSHADVDTVVVDEPEPRRLSFGGLFMNLFEARNDFDLDGCSITLDLDMDELVADDFNDHTIMLPESAAPLLGVGLPVRLPARRI